MCEAIECETDTPPVLGEHLFEVNGYIVDGDGLVRVCDSVRILIPYSDAGCDLRCGEYSYSFESPEEARGQAGSLPSNLPCSSDDGDIFVGFDFSINRLGEYTYGGRVTDFCGGRSEFVSGSFTVD